MSINYTDNTYVKIGSYANVVNEIPKAKLEGGGVSRLHGLLDQLVYKLALVHHEWQFVGEDSWYNRVKEGYEVKRLRIYEGPDQIGSILIDTWREPKFEIRNARINAAMAKRNHKSTKDVDKAVKIVEQFFKSKTMTERVSEARTKVSSAIQNRKWTAEREFSTVLERLAPALATYVSLHMAEVRPILEAYGAPASALDMLVERNETRKLTANVSDIRNKNTGTTVLLHGDRYILMPGADPDNVQTVTASQLNDDMRGKLGVLKVVNDNDAIESVGMRIDSTTFYLLP